MTKARTLILLVVGGHWITAIWHLFITAKILPAPNNHVAWLGITLISLGHLVVSIVVWRLKDRVAGWVTLVFFLAAMGADVYEHFIQTAPNNVLMVAASDWTMIFVVSVFLLLGFEILGCVAGMRLISGPRRSNGHSHLASRGVVS